MITNVLFLKVKSDEEAIALMNDSEFGLTASIWTTDYDAAVAIGNRVETGTWFCNRYTYKCHTCTISLTRLFISTLLLFNSISSFCIQQ